MAGISGVQGVATLQQATPIRGEGIVVQRMAMVVLVAAIALVVLLVVTIVVVMPGNCLIEVNT